ncbi:MAG TPA: PAS domain S-box protein, partial [Candidatus Binatia bacterium]|nr:PAS domain S-box protein [Candidatus Binatia bacterium]
MFKRIAANGMKLKWHLIALILAAVLPILIFTGFMFWREVELQREAVLRQMLDRARALSLAIDREIGIVRARLETLADSSYLDARDFKSFYNLCMQAVAWDPLKRRIILFDRSGRQIINTSRPFGERLPNLLRNPVPQRFDKLYPELPVGPSDPVKKALQGEVVVSDMFIDSSFNRPTVTIGVPVTREDGRIIYALAMSMEPTVLTGLMLEQYLPTDWLGLIVDRRGIVIGRTIEPERFVGRLSSVELTAQAKSPDEAWGRRFRLDEDELYQAFVRSDVAGWIVSVVVPQGVIDGPLLRAEAFLASGGVIFLLLGLCAAWVIGSRIAAPIAKLAASADAIQRGEGIDLKGSAVREVRGLHEAFLRASTVAREAAAEHQQRLVAEARELEAKAAKEKIEESESKLREYAHMLELAPVLARDQEGRIIFWNRGMESVYGWNKEEALGRMCHELLQTQFPEPLAEINRRLDSTGEWKGELKQRTRSGDEICVLSDWIAQRDENGNVRATIEVSDDITERKHAEDLLLYSEERLRAVVGTAVDGIITIDERGTISTVNPAAERIFGYTAAEMVGENVRMFMPDPYQSAHDSYISNYLRTGQRKIIGAGREVQGRRKDGTTFPLDLAVSETHVGDKRMFTGIVRDITERKLAEELLRQAKNDLVKANEDLERRVQERTADLKQANAALLRNIEEQKKLEEQLRHAQKMESIGTLAGGIAHEFNNILNVIQGYASLIRLQRSADRLVDESLKIIDQQIKRAVSVVRQLLTVARRTATHLEPVYANDLVLAISELVKQSFPKTIEVVLDLNPGLPPVMADSNQLSQAILNVCVNARDAMPVGGKLTIRTEKVDENKPRALRLEASPQSHVSFVISDTGMGMDEEVRARIFEPFFTTKGVGEGTGLGLAIVYGIVKEHNGFIEVESA